MERDMNAASWSNPDSVQVENYDCCPVPEPEVCDYMGSRERYS